MVGFTYGYGYSAGGGVNSRPKLSNNNSVITALARQNPAPKLVNNNSVITATARQ